MKRNSLILLALVALVMTGCKNNSSSQEPVEEEKKVTVKMKADLNSDSTEYNLDFLVDDEFFKKDANEYDPDLALLSFGASIASTYEATSNEFFTALGFENYFITQDYNGSSEHSISYSINHKTIDDFNLLAVNIRGFEYEKEWADNFNIGSTGNHAGFEARAEEIYTKLGEVIQGHSLENLKLWITGYSRAGAISNVLAHKIMSRDDIAIDTKDLFVYTFEAPNALSEENAITYANVHNIINSGDLITYIPPQEYGLYRCGVDIDIYSNKMDRLVYEFDKGIDLGTFTAADGKYTNEPEYNQYVINTLLKVPTDESYSEYALSTREMFVERYEENIGYFISLMMSLEPSTLNKIMTKFEKLDMMGKFMLLGDDGFYNFLKPILVEDEVAFDDEDFKAACTSLQNLLKLAITNEPSIMTSLAGGNLNLTRILKLHFPEVTYVLLKEHNK